jgi:hypothetical protein
VAHLQPPRTPRTVRRADILIRRNHVLLAQAQAARSRSAAIALTAGKDSTAPRFLLR